MQTDPLFIAGFSSTDVSLYSEYRRIKHAVFVLEHGWLPLKDPVADTAAIDPFDDRASLFIAKAGGEEIGIVRAVAIDGDFPHKELFLKHMGTATFKDHAHELATLNGLAVLKNKRRIRFVDEASGRQASCGMLLMMSAISALADQGRPIMVVTVSNAPSARLCVALGYQAIDDARLDTAWAPCILNMALVHGSRRHRAAVERFGGAVPKAPTPEVEAYVDAAESAVVQGNDPALFVYGLPWGDPRPLP